MVMRWTMAWTVAHQSVFPWPHAAWVSDVSGAMDYKPTVEDDLPHVYLRREAPLCFTVILHHVRCEVCGTMSDMPSAGDQARH